MLDPIRPDEITPPARGEGVAVVAYLIALVILEALPFLGVECLFGWCVVQDEDWYITAAGVALPVLLVGFAIAALRNRFSGEE